MIPPVPDPAPRPAPSLRFTDVTRRYGRLSVLRGVSGEAGGGEVLLVTGPNGSGKSTLLRCLAGLLAPDAGTIEMRLPSGPAGGAGGAAAGPVLDAGERRRTIGYVAPDLAFYEELTTEENLVFFARLRGVSAESGTALLDRLGLPRDRAAGALSSGMRQKLRWCWALLHRPALLLLDEPFQNLDAHAEALVRRLLVEHLDAGGLAVLAQPVDPAIDPEWRVARHVALAG